MTDTKRRLRIAVLNRVFSPIGGGAERYSIALVEQLAARHEIHVFAQQIDHQWPGVTYHTVSKPLVRSGWLNQLWYASATWWATRRGFDVVHSHENIWHGQVQTVHVLPVKYKLFHGRTGWRLALQWLKVATSLRLMTYLGMEHVRFSNAGSRRIVVTSNAMMNQMACTYPATVPALRLVSPGVTMTGALATTEQQIAARQRMHLPPTGLGILFVGNDYRKKGLTTLIKALAELSGNTWLAVVGNAAQSAEFKAQAMAGGVTDRVFFLGSLKDVNDAYLAVDCLAHPTLEDSFGMVVLEAMAHGLPVIVSSARYCGISDLLTDGVNAILLAEPRDSKALASALCRVIQTPSLRCDLAEAAMAFARSHQWLAVALQQEMIYFSLLDAKV